MTDPLVIGDVIMPPLKTLTIAREKIWAPNTGRAANGDTIGDLIAIKYKLECEFIPLDRTQAAVIDMAVSPAFFNATFTDPSSNSRITRRFYAGTPTYPVYSYVNGIKTYVGVKVNLIEK